ncbi:hypothetical protein [Planctomicrobium sp. SH664]|uniref:hypothetical protein n=1 Tax=Planctomicrobium sp. SH664 TaxID=3448125 RepID=UPI003F5ADEFA
MKTFLTLLGDETGFIVSAKLIRMETVVAWGMIFSICEASSPYQLPETGGPFFALRLNYRHYCSNGHKAAKSGIDLRDRIETSDGTFAIQ